jgi:hypothetical protein
MNFVIKAKDIAFWPLVNETKWDYMDGLHFDVGPDDVHLIGTNGAVTVCNTVRYDLNSPKKQVGNVRFFVPGSTLRIVLDRDDEYLFVSFGGGTIEINGLVGGLNTLTSLHVIENMKRYRGMADSPCVFDVGDLALAQKCLRAVTGRENEAYHIGKRGEYGGFMVAHKRLFALVMSLQGSSVNQETPEIFGD